MEFPFPSWGFAYAVIAVIFMGMVVVVVCLPDPLESSKVERRAALKRGLTNSAFIMIILYTVANCVVYFALGDRDPSERTLTNIGVVEELYDFTPGEAYPAVIGSTGQSARLSGSGYQVYLHGSFTVEGSSTSYVRMSINRADGVSNIVELPIDKIDFLQKPEVAPSVSIELNKLDRPDWATYEWQDATYEPRIIWGWWTRELIEPGRIAKIASEKSLQEIIADDVTHATIELTPEQYLSILGGTPSEK